MNEEYVVLQRILDVRLLRVRKIVARSLTVYGIIQFLCYRLVTTVFDKLTKHEIIKLKKIGRLDVEISQKPPF